VVAVDGQTKTSEPPATWKSENPRGSQRLPRERGLQTSKSLVREDERDGKLSNDRV
jgi:hypothetical protein